MPSRSIYPDVEIPDVDIWTLLFKRKDREFPEDKVICIDADTNRSYNYAQVRDTAITFGKSLKALWDWKLGDVLAIFSPNCIDTPIVFWGTQWAGGVLSPANPGYTSTELFFQLKDSGAKAIITQKPYLALVEKACQDVGIDSSRIILMGDAKDESLRFTHLTDFIALENTTMIQQTSINPSKDLAYLVYSSGTTGPPKGVMLSHRNIVSNLLMHEAVDGDQLSWKGGKDNQGDKSVGFLPFFHIYGIHAVLHHSFYKGLCFIVIQKFDLGQFCSIIQDYGITYAYVVPPIILLLAKSPLVSRYDLSSLRMLISAAAPLGKDLAEALYARIQVPVRQAYGLSETSPATHLVPWEKWHSSLGSVGFLLPNQTAKYMSADGREVPTGQAGELWIKGPNIFLGYLNNLEATKNAITDDGFFKTGDVGYQDEHGNFFITDRSKELIKYKGFQVAPAELEDILLGHPHIADVAVIGIHNPEQATEVPVAYVVLKQGVEQNELAQEISEWLQGKVSNHKRLRGGVRFVKEIPKTASGKILRRVLREQAKNENALRQHQSKL